MPVPRTLPRTIKEFWQLTRSVIAAASHRVPEKLAVLQQADLPTVQRILIQYRWFAAYSAGDLAILIAKLPASELRSKLAVCLDDELGRGNPDDSRIAQYDRFLIGLGVTPDDIEYQVDPEILALLELHRTRMHGATYLYGIGLEAMGAECLCHVYLQAMRHHLLENPVVQQASLDWTFWDHTCEADHGGKTRAAIERVAETGDTRELARGYLDAEERWRRFWDIAHAAGTEDRPGLSEEAELPSDGWRYRPAPDES